jgi:phage FluMu protein Com
LKIACPPCRDIEKFQEISASENHGIYLIRSVRDETRGIDLHNGTGLSPNGSALQVACPPPGIGAKISGKALRTASELLT